MFVSMLSSLKFTRELAYALWKSSPRVGSYFVGGVYGSGDRMGKVLRSSMGSSQVGRKSSTVEFAEWKHVNTAPCHFLYISCIQRNAVRAQLLLTEI